LEAVLVAAVEMVLFIQDKMVALVAEVVHQILEAVVVELELMEQMATQTLMETMVLVLVVAVVALVLLEVALRVEVEQQHLLLGVQQLQLDITFLQLVTTLVEVRAQEIQHNLTAVVVEQLTIMTQVVKLLLNKVTQIVVVAVQVISNHMLVGVALVTMVALEL
jgi:hypothetical protein